jgi:peptide deformylase
MDAKVFDSMPWQSERVKRLPDPLLRNVRITIDRLFNRHAARYDRVMSVRPEELRIIHYPDPILRTKAQPVARITDEVRAVALRMIDLMHEAPGVGLAAPQVGLPWRLFVANPTGEPGDDRVYINPVLSSPSAETDDHEEGCLSLPEILADIRRPKGITLDALDLDGNPLHDATDEFLARIWQHETDHLDGVLIIDRMAGIDRLANRRKLRELEADAKR